MYIILTLIFSHDRSSGTNLRANKFLLCVSSPFLHKMICGSFSECMAPRLELEDVDGAAYSDVLDLWCGKEGLVDNWIASWLWRTWRIGLG